MSEILTRNDVERLLEEIAYPRSKTRPNPQLLLAHDDALRAALAAKTEEATRNGAANIATNEMLTRVQEQRDAALARVAELERLNEDKFRHMEAYGAHSKECERLLRLACERLTGTPVAEQSPELADISLGIDKALERIAAALAAKAKTGGGK